MTLKKHMKFTIVFTFMLITVLMVSSLSLPTKVCAEAYLPRDWYVLPEDDRTLDLDANNSANNKAVGDLEKRLGFRLNREEKKLQDLDYSFDRIVSTNEDIFDNLNSNLINNTNNTINKSITSRGWGLGRISSIFTVSASGIFGLISGKGSTSLTLWWAPRPKETPKETPNTIPVPASKEVLSETDGEIPTISIYEGASDSDIKKELASIIKVIKIKNKNIDTRLLENGLIKRAREFKKLAYSLSAVSSAITATTAPVTTNNSNNVDKAMCWYPYKLRSDILIGANGNVLAKPVSITVGGDIFIRMEWVRLEHSGRSESKIGTNKSSDIKASLPMDKMQLEMQKIATTVSGSLGKISSKMVKHDRFDFDGIRLAIGLNGSGNIYVAKVYASILGHLYFKKEECKGQVTTVVKNIGINKNNNEEDEILIEGDANSRNFELARSLKIPYVLDSSPISDSKSIFKRAFYKTKAKKFAAGLEKSVKIATFFSDSIVKREERSRWIKRWQINKVWSGYAISLTGTSGVVTVGGNMQMELEFTRKK